MSEENRRRMAAREERDRLKVTEADVEEYTRHHYPKHIAEDYVPGRRGRPMPVPDDRYVAALDHDRFHQWFGTECDDTCPHARSRRVTPPPEAREFLVRMAREEQRACARSALAFSFATLVGFVGSPWAFAPAALLLVATGHRHVALARFVARVLAELRESRNYS